MAKAARKPAYRQEKEFEISTQILATISRYNTQGFGLEAMAAAANALQEAIASYGANNHIPHFESADAAMRGVTHLLNDPLNERYVLEQLQKTVRFADNEFRILEAQAQAEAPDEMLKPKGKYKFELIDGGLVPVT